MRKKVVNTHRVRVLCSCLTDVAILTRAHKTRILLKQHRSHFFIFLTQGGLFFVVHIKKIDIYIYLPSRRTQQCPCPSLLVPLSSSKDTCTTGSDETHLLSRGGTSGHGGRVTHVLVVSTTVRMLYWVHCDTTDLGPVVTFHSEFVEVVTSLKHRLISTTSTGNNSYYASSRRHHRLLVTAREPDAALSSIVRVTDENARGTTRATEGASVSNLLLHHGHDRTLGALVQGNNVTHGKLGACAGIDKLPGVASFNGGDEGFANPVTVRVSKRDTGERCSTTGIVDNFLNQTFNVLVTFNVVHGPEPGGTFSVFCHSFKDASGTLTLPTNNSTHVLLTTP